MENPSIPGYIENGDFEAGVERIGGIEAVTSVGYSEASDAPGASLTSQVVRAGNYSGRATNVVVHNTAPREVVFRIWNLELGKRYRISAFLASSIPLDVVMEPYTRSFNCQYDESGQNGSVWWSWGGISGGKSVTTSVEPGVWTKSQIEYVYDFDSLVIPYEEIFLHFDAQGFDTERTQEYFIDDIEIVEIPF